MEIVKSKKVCTLCTDSIISPISLACNHVFCKECVEKRLKFHYNGSAAVVCPMNCEQQSRIPNDATASYLVTDVRTYVGSDAYTTSPDSRILCHWKTCERKMTRFCVTCNVTFCRRCWDRHLVQCRNTAPYIPVVYNYRKGEMKVVCSVHQTSADYVCLNCDYKFICVYCKHRSHKGHFVEQALQSSICLKRSNIRALYEEKERVGMNVSEYHFFTIKECEEKLKLELMKRKLKCFRDYSDFINREEENILREFRNQVSSFESDETSTLVYQGPPNCATYSKPLFYDIRITSSDLHSLGTMTMNVYNSTDQFKEGPPLISLHLHETEIDLKSTTDLRKELESLIVNAGDGGRDQSIDSVDDTYLKPDTSSDEISPSGQLSHTDDGYGEGFIAPQSDDYQNDVSEDVQLNDNQEHGEDNCCNPIDDLNEVPKVGSKAGSIFLERAVNIHSNLEKNTQEAENQSLQEVKTNLNHMPDNDELGLNLDLVDDSEVSQGTSVELNSAAQSIVDINDNCDLVEDNQVYSRMTSGSHGQTRSSNDFNDSLHLKVDSDTIAKNRTKSKMVADNADKNLLNPDAVPVFFPSKNTCTLSLKSSPSSEGQCILNPEATPVFYAVTKAQRGVEELVLDSTTTTDQSLARFLAAASAYSIDTKQALRK